MQLLNPRRRPGRKLRGRRPVVFFTGQYREYRLRLDLFYILGEPIGPTVFRIRPRVTGFARVCIDCTTEVKSYRIPITMVLL